MTYESSEKFVETFQGVRDSMRSEYDARPIWEFPLDIVDLFLLRSEYPFRRARDILLIASGIYIGTRLSMTAEKFVDVFDIDPNLIRFILISMRLSIVDSIQSKDIFFIPGITKFLEKKFGGIGSFFASRIQLYSHITSMFNTDCIVANYIREALPLQDHSRLFEAKTRNFKAAYRWIRRLKTFSNGIIIGFFGREFGFQIMPVLEKIMEHFNVQDSQWQQLESPLLAPTESR